MNDDLAFDPFDDHQPVPWELFGELRLSCPVMELPGGILLVSRYEDVHDILKDGGERVRHFSHEGGMRAPGVTVRHGSGVGLGVGLYLARYLVERHEGSIGVASEIGKGTTFTIRLPLIEPAHTNESASAQ